MLVRCCQMWDCPGSVQGARSGRFQHRTAGSVGRKDNSRVLFASPTRLRAKPTSTVDLNPTILLPTWVLFGRRCDSTYKHDDGPLADDHEHGVDMFVHVTSSISLNVVTTDIMPSCMALVCTGICPCTPHSSMTRTPRLHRH